MPKWRVMIERSDGERHRATVRQVSTGSECATVEWYEDGETLTKDISFETIRSLNPNFDARMKTVTFDESGHVDQKGSSLLEEKPKKAKAQSRTKEKKYSNKTKRDKNYTPNFLDTEDK